MPTESPEQEGFGARLGSAIRKAGVTQRALAERLDVSETTVSNWVRGTRGKPQEIQTLVQIAKILHTSLDYLLSVPGATPPRDVQAAVDEAVRRARADLRAAILAAFDEPKEDARRR